MANGIMQNMPVRFMGGYPQEDVLQHAKNMAANTIEIWADSNNPPNQPSGCSWGAYIFFCTQKSGVKFVSILYLDKAHIASTYTITNETETINWHIA